MIMTRDNCVYYKWVGKTGILVMLLMTLLSARELCKARLDCPPDFDGETVYVGYDVVMLAEAFEHCAPTEVLETDTTPDTISLFLIIDHSSSMSIMDPTSNRYKGACELIDSMAAQSPASEIGIAVFSNKLLYHHDDDSFFKQLSNTQGWNDSYVPLTKLNSQVGSMSATEKLKWAIEVDPSQQDLGNNYTLVNGNYNNSGRNSYTGTTDISLAFEAAKEAFQSATYEKKRHYVVLFSDGIAQNVDAAREPYLLEYIDGEDAATTFTAYFVKTGMPIPNEIKNMTTNIKENGYSATNQFSDVWRTQGEISEFFGKIFGVITGGIKVITSTPKSMTINGVTSTTFDSVDAFFDPLFAVLDKNGELTLDVSYTWHWNDPKNKDTTATYSVSVKQASNPDLESIDCWNQGRLCFVFDGAEISFARPDQLTLDLRFYPPDSGNVPSIGTTVAVELTNVGGSDKLDLTLNKEALGRFYEVTFTREYAAAVAGDNILQNSANDSLIAVYRNADIPLDTVRHAITVNPPIELAVHHAFYKDEDADGFPEMIGAMQAGGEVLTGEECDMIKEYMDILGPRNIVYVESVTPCSYGFTIAIPENDTREPFTGVYYGNAGAIDEKVNIEEIGLPSGQTFPYTNAEIYDSMAPVVLKGVFCPGFMKKEGVTVLDTLVVTFSETVPTPTPTDQEPFKFLDLSANDNSKTWRMKLTPVVKQESAVQTFLVESLLSRNPPQWYPQDGDSLWIDHTAHVEDLLRNVQDNEFNRRAPLSIKPYQFAITVIAVPNPLTPDDLEEVIPIEGMEDKQGMVIKAKVVGPWVPHISLKGTITLFDAVGNRIRTLEGEQIDDDPKDGIKETVVFVWDGTNQYDRLVGSGAYVGIVSVVSGQSIRKKQQIMLGIQTETP